MKKFLVAVVLSLVCFNVFGQGWYRTKHKGDELLGIVKRYEYRSPKWMMSYEEPSVHIYSDHTQVYISPGRYDLFKCNYNANANVNTIDVVIGFYDHNDSLVDNITTTFICSEYDWAHSTSSLGNTIIKWIKHEGNVKMYATNFDGFRLTYKLDYNPNIINDKIQ